MFGLECSALSELNTEVALNSLLVDCSTCLDNVFLLFSLSLIMLVCMKEKRQKPSIYIYKYMKSLKEIH